MKISVFIPCAPWHFKNVKSILQAYKDQSRVPDEVVIMLSGGNEVSPADRINLQKHFRGFLRLIVNGTRMYAGPARQVALNRAKGDIIMYHDADDLPHVDRCKVIEKFFEENKKCKVVCHSYNFRQWKPWDGKYTIHNAYDRFYEQYFPGGDFLKSENQGCFGGGIGFPVHAGVPCLRKEILKDITWKAPEQLVVAPPPKNKTEDYEFEMECLYNLKKAHYIIDAPIYLYMG